VSSLLGLAGLMTVAGRTSKGVFMFYSFTLSLQSLNVQCQRKAR
jgi:hypothetical protein